MATKLILNRKQNYANRRLVDDAAGDVGYQLPNGEHRYVRWLGFIERRDALALPGARPVRLVNISRVGRQGAISDAWDDIPADRCVHGCLTDQGAYAIYDEQVAFVPTSTSKKMQ